MPFVVTRRRLRDWQVAQWSLRTEISKDAKSMRFTLLKYLFKYKLQNKVNHWSTHLKKKVLVSGNGKRTKTKMHIRLAYCLPRTEWRQSGGPWGGRPRCSARQVCAGPAAKARGIFAVPRADVGEESVWSTHLSAFHGLQSTADFSMCYFPR